MFKTQTNDGDEADAAEYFGIHSNENEKKKGRNEKKNNNQHVCMDSIWRAVLGRHAAVCARAREIHRQLQIDHIIKNKYSGWNELTRSCLMLMWYSTQIIGYVCVLLLCFDMNALHCARNGVIKWHCKRNSMAKWKIEKRERRNRTKKKLCTTVRSLHYSWSGSSPTSVRVWVCVCV